MEKHLKEVLKIRVILNGNIRNLITIWPCSSHAKIKTTQHKCDDSLMRFVSLHFDTLLFLTTWNLLKVLQILVKPGFNLVSLRSLLCCACFFF